MPGATLSPMTHCVARRAVMLDGDDYVVARLDSTRVGKGTDRHGSSTVVWLTPVEAKALADALLKAVA